MKRLLIPLLLFAAIPLFGQTVRSTNFVATNDTKALTFTSQAANPADSGVLRFGNGELIAWEASPAGTDVTLTVDSAEQFVFSSGISGTSVTLSSLTITRVPFATTAGLLTDAASFVFNSGTGALSATSFVGQLNGTIASATTATTQSAADNSTKVATTAYADAAVTAGATAAATATEVNTGTNNTKMITPLALAGSGLPSYQGIQIDTLTPPMTDPQWVISLATVNTPTLKEVVHAPSANSGGIYYGDNIVMFSPDTTVRAAFPANVFAGARWHLPAGTANVTISYDAKVGTAHAGNVFVSNLTYTVTRDQFTPSPQYDTTYQAYSHLSANITASTTYFVSSSMNVTTTLSPTYSNFKVTPNRAATGVFSGEFIRIEPRGNMQDFLPREPLVPNSSSNILTSVFYQNSFSHLDFWTDQVDMVVEFACGTATAAYGIGVWVDKKPYVQITPATTTLEQQAVTLPAGRKLVSLVAGPQGGATGYPVSSGAYIRAAYLPHKGTTTLAREPQSGPKVLVYGDSIAVTSYLTGTTNSDKPALQSWPLVFRQLWNGEVATDAWGTRSLNQDYLATGALNQLVARWARINPDIIILTIGTNDYGLNLWTAADFGVQYANLLDKIHEAVPNAYVVCFSPINRGTETANGLGSTLGDYRTQISTVATAIGRTSWCLSVNGNAVISTANDLGSDAIHPTVTGTSRIARYLLDQLGAIKATPASIGAIVPNGTSFSAYGAGTAYAFTNTAAAVDFSTTDPSFTITGAGTYLVSGQVNVAYNGATVIAETATLKLRRTNNTAADLTGATITLDLPTSTTVTNSYGTVTIPPIFYSTANADDAVTIFVNVSAGLGAGTIDATAVGTSITAFKIR